jgi:hypothetical protein
MDGQALQKVGDTSAELDRHSVWIGFPIRAQEELFWIVVIVQVSEDHLGVHVAPESASNKLKIFPAGGVVGGRTEVESKPEEGLELGRWLTGCAQVVTGKVSGAGREEKRRLTG